MKRENGEKTPGVNAGILVENFAVLEKMRKENLPFFRKMLEARRRNKIKRKESSEEADAVRRKAEDAALDLIVKRVRDDVKRGRKKKYK